MISRVLGLERGRERGAAARRSALGKLGVALSAALAVTAAASAARGAPDWVESGGHSAAHPESRYVTGFAMSLGRDRLARARSAAAADLAGRVVVRIEHELRDVATASGPGTDRTRVASITRSTSDVKLHGLHYLVYETRSRSYALAFVDRGAAAAARRRDRERALVEVRSCLAMAALYADQERPAEATRTYERCRTPIAAALEHDAVAAALRPAEGAGSSAHVELVAATREVDEQMVRLRDAPFSGLRDAASALARQLIEQGLSPHEVGAVAPFTYGTTDVSSEFGRSAAQAVESALAAKANGKRRARSAAALRGVYLEQPDGVRMTVTARDPRSGALLTSAEVKLSHAGVGPAESLRPTNFLAALADQRVLAEDELRRADLSLDLWTSRGRRGLVYEAGEELTLYLRVNRPAWVRLVYVLQNGLQVPIDQGFAIGGAEVNAVVEYPERFEVVAPFGVEHVHATAFTREPEALQTRHRRVDGIDYEVVAEGLEGVVRARGLRRLGHVQTSESLITLTTMPGRAAASRARLRSMAD